MRWTRAQIEAWATESDAEVLLADGFDAAIVGLAQRFNAFCVVYDRGRCLKILVKGGLTPEEAEEYFEFNVVGAFVGDSTPIFLLTPPEAG